MKTRLLSCTLAVVSILTAGALLSPAPARAATVFSDDFSDNDASDWTKSTNYGGTSVVDGSTGSMEVYLDAPPGGTDLFVTATHDFTIGADGPLQLSFSAASGPCSGCTIRYNVYLDGVNIYSNPTFGAVELASLALGNLSLGLHTLGLGVTTETASSGHFYATFDNISIVQTPIPPALLMFGTALGGIGFLGYRRKKLAAAA